MNITIVIPTIEGREGLLARALATVEAQTFPPSCVIVELDVGRQGAAATRNQALSKVDTDWLAFLDDDDELYPNHLKVLARYAKLSTLDVAYPGYDTTGGEDPVKCFGVPFDGALLQKRNFIPVTTLCRTSHVLQAGGFQPHPDENDDPCEDWGLWLAMHAAGSRFTHVPVRTWRWNLGDTTKGRPQRPVT